MTESFEPVAGGQRIKMAIIGRPGVGKTTLAGLIGNILAERGYYVALPTEAARAFIEREGRPIASVTEQYEIMVEQRDNEVEGYKAGADFIICDSSTFLNYIYALLLDRKTTLLADLALLPAFLHEVLQWTESYDAIFFLKGPYVELEADPGRVHTDREELEEIERTIESFLGLYGIPYIVRTVDIWERGEKMARALAAYLETMCEGDEQEGAAEEAVA